MSHEGFLTHVKNATLPHQPMDIRLLIAIEEGIRCAWKIIVGDEAKHTEMLDTKCKEVDITVDLEFALDRALQEASCSVFTDLHFVAPKRGVECVNFNGERLEKRPDLMFCLKDRRPGIDLSNYDAVFAECKVVDTKSSKNMGWYVKGGLSKFVQGDYAWAMPDALMIAYVRTTQKLPESLTEYFSKKTGGIFNSVVYNLIEEPKICKQSNSRTIYRVCRTQHERHWGYPPDGKRNPGNITIRHLWLEI